MSDLNISQKSIYSIFSERGVNFLIPDYQRNYSWEREHCEILWEDFKSFAIPDDDADSFDDDNDEYFLGAILTFRNDSKQKEIIDGQQRLIALLLLLRAFYKTFDENENPLRSEIEKCIWRIGRDGTSDKSRPKIKSEVASDEDIAEFEKIIFDGEATKDNKNNYATNYRYFQRSIAEFKQNNPDNFSDFVRRILYNCILLPIETTSQSAALRIFTTLNDRGMPLSDSDIFKAQFYKFYRGKGKQEKENFIRRWKEIEKLCNKNFHPRTGTPLDDLFMRYMYYLLAKSETKSQTFHGLRPFYEKNNYAVLQSEKTFTDLEILANFWNDITERNEERLSERVLKRLYVLNYCPYGMWSYIVSLYFMGNRDSKNKLDDDKFYEFLQKITAVFFMYAIANPGVHNTRLPFFLEFQNILHGRSLTFKDSRRDRKFFREQLVNMKFSNSKLITRAMLAWWTFENPAQELPPLDTRLEIEHIYAKKRAELQPLKDPENLELLGNKVLLEKRINIRASDYRFEDKKKIYLGYIKNGKTVAGTDILELRHLAEKNDFTEDDIWRRDDLILKKFIDYLEENNLLK